VALLAIWLDQSERVGSKRLLGLVVGILGVGVLLGLDVGGDANGLLGAGMVLAAALCYAFGALLIKRRFSDIPQLGAIPPPRAARALARPAGVAAPARASPVRHDRGGGRRARSLVHRTRLPDLLQADRRGGREPRLRDHLRQSGDRGRAGRARAGRTPYYGDPRRLRPDPGRVLAVDRRQLARPFLAQSCRKLAPRAWRRVILVRRSAAAPAVSLMFESLSEKLQAVFDRLGRKGKLTEEDVEAALREVRVALLEADVSLKVVRQFVAAVKEKAVGQEVLQSLTPAQTGVKIVHDELGELRGARPRRLTVSSKPPTVVMLVGLQGAGKTTLAAKLALQVRKMNHTPLLVAADPYRPAAVDQLQTLGKQIEVPVFHEPGKKPPELAQAAVKYANQHQLVFTLIDTAG